MDGIWRRSRAEQSMEFEFESHCSVCSWHVERRNARVIRNWTNFGLSMAGLDVFDAVVASSAAAGRDRLSHLAAGCSEEGNRNSCRSSPACGRS